MDGRTNRTSRKNANVSIPLNNNLTLDAIERRRSVGINNSRMNWNSNYLGPSVDFKMMGPARIKSDDVALKERMPKSGPAENFDSNFPVLGVVVAKQTECSKPVSLSISQSTTQKPFSVWANSPATLLESPTPCDSLVTEPESELETLKMLIPKTVSKPKQKSLKYSTSLNGSNSCVRKSPVRMEPSNVRTNSVLKLPVNVLQNVATMKPSMKPALLNFQSMKPTFEIVTKSEIEKDVDPYFDSDPAWDDDGSEGGASTSMSGSTILGSLDGYNNSQQSEVLDSWDDYEGEDMTVIGDAVSTSPILKEESSIKHTTEPIKCPKLEPYTALFKYSKSIEKEEEFLQRLGWNKNMYYDDNVNENEFVISQAEVEDFLKSVGKV